MVNACANGGQGHLNGWAALPLLVAAPADGTVVLIDTAAVKAAGADGVEEAVAAAALAAVSIGFILATAGFVIAPCPPAIDTPVAANCAAVVAAAADLTVGSGWWLGLPVFVGPPAMHAAVLINRTAVDRTGADRAEAAFRRAGFAVIIAAPTVEAVVGADCTGVVAARVHRQISGAGLADLAVLVGPPASNGSLSGDCAGMVASHTQGTEAATGRLLMLLYRPPALQFC